MPHTPACRSKTQLGCVVAFSTFNQTPPSDSLFGRSSDPNLQVLCTNPATLGSGSANLDSIEPTTPYASGLIAAGIYVKARVEEEFLRQQLGESYAAYAHRVPMLVPFLRFRS